MSELLILVKIAALVIGLVVVICGVASFIAWENIFRRIEPMFMLRLLTVIVAATWIIRLFPEAAQ